MAATPPRQRAAPPPPVIGKAGRYTVFLTPPPATPRQPPENTASRTPNLPGKPAAENTVSQTPVSRTPNLPGKPAAVQVPPANFGKAAGRGESVFGFFWDAVAKVKNAHSSLDEYLAEWLGLNQSRYQWALDDYFENTGSSKDCEKPKEQISKDQTV